MQKTHCDICDAVMNTPTLKLAFGLVADIAPNLYRVRALLDSRQGSGVDPYFDLCESCARRVDAALVYTPAKPAEPLPPRL